MRLLFELAEQIHLLLGDPDEHPLPVRLDERDCPLVPEGKRADEAQVLRLPRAESLTRRCQSTADPSATAARRKTQVEPSAGSWKPSSSIASPVASVPAPPSRVPASPGGVCPKAMLVQTRAGPTTANARALQCRRGQRGL